VSRGPDGSVLLGRSALLFRLALVAGVLGLVEWVYSSGLLEGLTAEQVRTDILALGPWGIVVWRIAQRKLRPSASPTL
jgi:hypothetical protein